MLKKRIIPKLLIKTLRFGNRSKQVLVITRKFNEIIPVGDPVSQAKIYESQLADELMLINLSKENQEPFIETLETMAKNLATPLAVGGSIVNLEQAEKLFKNGADKVVINTGAITNPQIIDELANKYGSQSVCLAIDIQEEEDFLYIRGKNNKVRVEDLIDWLEDVQRRGCGEILISDINRDGMNTGLNLDLMQRVRDICKVPLIISGGCGTSQHFVEGFRHGADAVAAGTFFSKRDQNPLQCRSHVVNAKISVRHSL